MALLYFGQGNGKLAEHIHTFSLPAGYTCPGALRCLAHADKRTGKIVNGKHQEFRCFAASGEVTYPGVRKSRHANLSLLRKAGSTEKMVELIEASLPKKAKIVRIHVGGDFFTQAYFDAWLQVTINHPGIIFYAYTKSLLFWMRRIHLVPDNFRLIASYGGKYDYLIKLHNLRSATVVHTVEEATVLGLTVDLTDEKAYAGVQHDIALLLHGPQKGVSLKAMKQQKQKAWKLYA